MTRQDLRLWYKQDNGKDIPDLNEFDTISEAGLWMHLHTLLNHKEYVEWLEEGLMAAKQIAQNLQSEIITIKSMNK